jgi:hypothetical protein
MIRSPGVHSWCLIGVSLIASCRVGYDEIFIIGQAVAGQGGTSATGGSNASSGGIGGSSGGVGGTEAGAGEAGADATGGTSINGGAGGTAASGGSSATGGKGGAPATGGSAGSSGGGAGTTGGATSGASGGGMGGASGGGMGGVSGGGMGGVSGGGMGGASGGGMGGVSGGGMGGASGGGTGGAGGYAGASSLGDCQTDTFGGHTYVFCNVNVAWTVARDNCASVGMFLVRVDDAAESQWVFDNVYDAPPRQGVWIGASDITTEGEWRWADGALFWLGTSMGSAQNGLFSAWYPTQPSGQGPRDCAALDGGTLGWYDLDCMTPQPYVCESP